MTAHDSPRLDIATLHELYRSGESSPEQLIGELYARMRAAPRQGVWIAQVDESFARAKAKALGPFVGTRERSLYGIPFAVKDNIDVAGLPTTAACPAFSYVPERSAESVQALLDAGAICLGKVNMDQFATGLVGTRSPYGACENVFDPAYLSGGSSSGSAIAVAAHLVSFSLGTDTAGSGRVPAALNNIVGLKPSVGLISNDGMVPACASLDCVSVFATSVSDAARVRDTMLGLTRPLAPRAAAFRFGVPRPLELFGDALSQACFDRALAQLEALGGEPVELDYTPFSELGDMLYGPYVVERYIGVGSFIEANEADVLPVTRDIILGGCKYSASDAFLAFQRAQKLRAACLRELANVDVLVTPTVAKPFRIADDRAEPRTVNDKLGIYTRFVNFIGCPVLSVPAAFRADGLPFGISFVGKPGHDTRLDGLAEAFHRTTAAGAGSARHPLPVEVSRSSRPAALEARLAVVGAHLRGMALNSQLLAVSARYVASVRTAPEYRLFALPNSTPERPGLVRSPENGVEIEIELWDLSWRALGEFMARVPAPLTIGTLLTADGEQVKGFLCESFACEGARDISEFGGYRAYVASRS